MAVYTNFLPFFSSKIMKASAPFRLFFALCMSLIPLLASAKGPAKVEGYWNVETNLSIRSYTIVRFYNNQDQLVYEEQLNNLCFDLSKSTGRCRRTARQLNTALQRILRNPETATQTTLLASEFGRNRRAQRLYDVR